MALPAITVSRLDVARLEALLATAHGEVAEGLEEELLRATVVAPEAMPADVVTMNSRTVSSTHLTLPTIYLVEMQ